MGIIFKVIVKKTLLFYFQSGVDRFVEFSTQTTAQNQKVMVLDTFFSMKFCAFSICKWIMNGTKESFLGTNYKSIYSFICNFICLLVKPNLYTKLRNIQLFLCVA